MKVVLVNGSPRPESNTLVIADAFLKGMSDFCEIEIKRYDLYKCNIKACTGCYSCWSKTAGKCVISDDMTEIRNAILDADMIVESFPLYFFGMPSQMKAFTDRLLPFTLQYVGGENFHELRYSSLENKHLAVISSCGYAQAEAMYGSLKAEYDLICGEDNYTSVFCGQGEILGLGTRRPQMRYYLGNIEKAGREFAEFGKLSADTKKLIAEPILPKAMFEAVAKSHWSQFDRVKL